MKARTTDERVAGAALILGGLVVMALLPLWAPLAAVWLIATGRNIFFRQGIDKPERLGYSGRIRGRQAPDDRHAWP